MTATLDEMAQRTPVGVTVEREAAAGLVRMAKERASWLMGPDGLFKQLTRSVIDASLGEAMTDHLGFAKGDAPSGPSATAPSPRQ